jgi:hypothetical protein
VEQSWSNVRVKALIFSNSARERCSVDFDSSLARLARANRPRDLRRTEKLGRESHLSLNPAAKTLRFPAFPLKHCYPDFLLSSSLLFIFSLVAPASPSPVCLTTVAFRVPKAYVFRPFHSPIATLTFRALLKNHSARFEEKCGRDSLRPLTPLGARRPLFRLFKLLQVPNPAAQTSMLGD